MNLIKTPKKMLSIKTIYKMDITISDQCLYVNYGPEIRTNRLALITKRVQKVLRFCNFRYKFYTEFSTPEKIYKASKAGASDIIPRVHFHGIVCFPSYKSLYSFYNVDCIRLIQLGRIEIDTIGDHTIWKDYITKDYETMKELTKLAGITEYPLIRGFPDDEKRIK